MRWGVSAGGAFWKLEEPHTSVGAVAMCTYECVCVCVCVCVCACVCLCELLSHV